MCTNIEALKQSRTNLVLEEEESFAHKVTENVRELKKTFRACYMQHRNPDDYTFQNLLIWPNILKPEKTEFQKKLVRKLIVGKGSEIFGKWSKKPSLLCLYNKQNNTWLLVDNI